MPFYQLYTPTDIRFKAEFTATYDSFTTTAITYDTGGTSRGRLFKLNLLPPDLLSSRADIVVVVTVGIDNTIRSGDSDPKFFLSDGTNGIGFEMREESSANRCRGIQAIMGDTHTSYTTITGADHESSFLPEQFVMTMKSSQRWGSCYNAIDSGVISPVSYTRSISLNKGLYLEVYREDTSEKYVFNYIMVEIHEN